MPGPAITERAAGHLGVDLAQRCVGNLIVFVGGFDRLDGEAESALSQSVLQFGFEPSAAVFFLHLVTDGRDPHAYAINRALFSNSRRQLRHLCFLNLAREYDADTTLVIRAIVQLPDLPV